MKKFALLVFVVIGLVSLVVPQAHSRAERVATIDFFPIVTPSTVFDCPNGSITAISGSVEISIASSDIQKIQKKFDIDSIVWFFEASEDAGCVAYYYIGDPCPRNGRIGLQKNFELANESKQILWNSDVGPPDCDFAGFYLIRAVIYSKGDFHYAETEVLVFTTVTKPAAEIDILERVCEKKEIRSSRSSDDYREERSSRGIKEGG